MRKFTKICLVTAAVFLIAGVALCAVGAAFGATLGAARSATETTQVGKLAERISQLSDWEVWSWDTDYSESYDVTDAYSYEKDAVKNLDISINAGTFTVGESKSDEVKVNVYLKNGTVDCGLDGDTLRIEDKTNNYALKNRHVEIELLLPEGMEFDDVNIDVAAGEVTSESQSFAADTLTVNVDAGEAVVENFTADKSVKASVGAGNIELSDMKTKYLSLDCGVGEINATGEVTGDIEGDCGVGELSIGVQGYGKDFNYRLDCGMGEITLGNSSFSGLSREKDIDNDADKTMSLDCGVGTIAVEFYQ